MTNEFYKSFDFECLQDRVSEYRTPFQQDRDRIIHSFAFRRLQAKTQVFFSGEYDFYRTRLTHSIEVAQIGRSICNFLIKESPELSENYYIDSDLVEAACLAHDLGHPPFGHAGETILNTLMLPFGGFEGNAQTLRMLTETIYSSKNKRKGMKPTRAFIDSVLKYKTTFSQWDKPINHYIYNDQKTYLDFIFAGREMPHELTPGKILNGFRSIECQIMDWADDTGYSLNDMVDGIKAGFITIEKIEKWAQNTELDDEEIAVVNDALDIIRSGSVTSQYGMKIGQFIQSCKLEKRDTFLNDVTNRYLYLLSVDPSAKKACSIYKNIAMDLVFNSPQLSQLEYKGHFMLKRLFETLLNNYVENKNSSLCLLPKDVGNIICSDTTGKHIRARLLCDYIAGMTDRYAIRFYKKLFDPDFGSIVDLL